MLEDSGQSVGPITNFILQKKRVCFVVCVCLGAQMLLCVSVQRTSFGTWFCSSTIWVLEIELRYQASLQGAVEITQSVMCLL